MVAPRMMQRVEEGEEEKTSENQSGDEESLHARAVWRAVDSSGTWSSGVRRAASLRGAPLLFLGVFLLAFLLPRRQRAEIEIQIKEGQQFP